MWGRRPYPPPLGQGNPAGPWQNPGGTIPFPAGENVPVGYYESPTSPLSWSAGSGQVLRTATWKSAIFDWRPDLRGVNGRSPINTQSIWGGSQLYVQLTGLNATPDGAFGVRVLAREFAHIFDPNRIRAVTAPQDMTKEIASVATDQPDAVWIFSPPGDGYPLRYWQVWLTFEVYEARASDPQFSLCSAVY